MTASRGTASAISADNQQKLRGAASAQPRESLPPQGVAGALNTGLAMDTSLRQGDEPASHRSQFSQKRETVYGAKGSPDDTGAHSRVADKLAIGNGAMMMGVHGTFSATIIVSPKDQGGDVKILVEGRTFVVSPSRLRQDLRAMAAEISEAR